MYSHRPQAFEKVTGRRAQFFSLFLEKANSTYPKARPKSLLCTKNIRKIDCVSEMSSTKHRQTSIPHWKISSAKQFQNESFTSFASKGPNCSSSYYLDIVILKFCTRVPSGPFSPFTKTCSFPARIWDSSRPNYLKWLEYGHWLKLYFITVG